MNSTLLSFNNTLVLFRAVRRMDKYDNRIFLYFVLLCFLFSLVFFPFLTFPNSTYIYKEWATALQGKDLSPFLYVNLNLTLFRLADSLKHVFHLFNAPFGAVPAENFMQFLIAVKYNSYFIFMQAFVKFTELGFYELPFLGVRLLLIRWRFTWWYYVWFVFKLYPISDLSFDLLWVILLHSSHFCP